MAEINYATTQLLLAETHESSCVIEPPSLVPDVQDDPTHDEWIFHLKDRLVSLLHTCDVLRAVCVPYPFSTVELVVTDLPLARAAIEAELGEAIRPFADRLKYREDAHYFLRDMSSVHSAIES